MNSLKYTCVLLVAMILVSHIIPIYTAYFPDYDCVGGISPPPLTEVEMRRSVNPPPPLPSPVDDPSTRFSPHSPAHLPADARAGGTSPVSLPSLPPSPIEEGYDHPRRFSPHSPAHLPADARAGGTSPVSLPSLPPSPIEEGHDPPRRFSPHPPARRFSPHPPAHPPARAIPPRSRIVIDDWLWNLLEKLACHATYSVITQIILIVYGLISMILLGIGIGLDVERVNPQFEPLSLVFFGAYGLYFVLLVGIFIHQIAAERCGLVKRKDFRNLYLRHKWTLKWLPLAALAASLGISISCFTLFWMEVQT